MSDNEDFKDLSPEEKLKAENELLKLKLQAEFGMNAMDSKLNEGVENQWLNHIYNFEKQFAEGKMSKLYDFIGRPKFRNADELTKEEISHDLKRLMDIMLSKSVRLDTICKYEDEVIYRFITEELFKELGSDIRIPGMMTCYIYEEFHPNHDDDIRKHSTEFIELLIIKKWDAFMNNILLASTVTYNDKEYEQRVFPEIIEAFQREHTKMKLLKWEINSVLFNLETKTATLEGFIKYKSVNSKQEFEGNVLLGLKLEYDYWSIRNIILPGFSS